MRYVIIGNYGSTNIGDEAILAAIVDRLRLRDKSSHITVLSYNPQTTERIHNVKAQVLFPAGVRSLYRAIFRGEIIGTIRALKKCDRVIFGGGGLFNDEKLAAVFLWFWQVFCAHFFCRNIFFYRQSVGPLNTRIGRYLTRKATEYCTRIYVRDSSSKELLTYLGVSDVDLRRDPVLDWKFVKRYVSAYYRLIYSGEKEPDENLSYIIVSLREWRGGDDKFITKIAKVLEKYCLEYDYRIFFVPYQSKYEDDAKIYRRLRAKIDKKVIMKVCRFNYENNFKQEMQMLLELYLGAERVVAMRLHALILAYMCRMDAVGIVYSKKVQSFVESVNFKHVSIKGVEEIEEVL